MIPWNGAHVGYVLATNVAANYGADAVYFSASAGTAGVEFICWKGEEDFVSWATLVFGGINSGLDEILVFEIRVGDFYFLEAEDLRPFVATEEFSEGRLGRRCLVGSFV